MDPVDRFMQASERLIQRHKQIKRSRPSATQTAPEIRKTPSQEAKKFLGKWQGKYWRNMDKRPQPFSALAWQGAPGSIQITIRGGHKKAEHHFELLFNRHGYRLKSRPSLSDPAIEYLGERITDQLVRFAPAQEDFVSNDYIEISSTVPDQWQMERFQQRDDGLKLASRMRFFRPE